MINMICGFIGLAIIVLMIIAILETSMKEIIWALTQICATAFMIYCVYCFIRFFT